VDFRDVFSLWCISLSFVFTLPQAWRVVRRNTVEGISVLGQLQGFCGATMWVVYGTVAATPLVVAGNGMVIVGVGTVVVQMVRLREIPARLPAVLFTAVFAFAVTMSMLSLTALGAVAAVVGGTGIIPQVYRSAKTPHLKGVSVSTNVLLAVMAVSWGLYGLMIDDLLVASQNVVLAPAAAFIAARAAWSHHHYANVIDASVDPAR
jgi:uncharacterized protein with PQ loop repeat